MGESLNGRNGGLIMGRNAVKEAIASDPSRIERLYIQDGLRGASAQAVFDLAREYGVHFEMTDRNRLDILTKYGHHQGVVALVTEHSYATVEDILEAARTKGEDPFIFVLDGIEDPHNLGAIIRTANVCGAHGVILPKRRACHINATVAAASAGATSHTPVAMVVNLSRTIDELKSRGLWFVCADLDGDVMYDVDLKGAIGLVIGNEGEGVSELVKSKCDFVATIPMKGEINSLNASVAAGVLAYEIVRQRR